MVRIEELLNPKNDYVFKRIFGQSENEEITKEMLSVIIKKSINDIMLNENTILEKDLVDDKIGIIDIHAKINKTIDVDIEMQIVNEKDIERRIMYYWSKLYIQGIHEGESYSKLNKTIVVLIADFELSNLKNIPKFYSKWQLREEEYSSVILTEVLELYILELPKAKRMKMQEERDIEGWINFLENPRNVVMEGMSEKNKVAIKKAKKVLEKISKDENEIYLAHLREKHIRDQKAIEEYGYDKGLEQRNTATVKNKKKLL